VEYYTNEAPAKGTVKWRQVLSAIGVVDGPDKMTLIGTAYPAGPTETGVATWHLRVRGADVPGVWTLVDSKFIRDYRYA
jgi:hypothetical protein